METLANRKFGGQNILPDIRGMCLSARVFTAFGVRVQLVKALPTSTCLVTKSIWWKWRGKTCPNVLNDMPGQDSAKLALPSHDDWSL